MAKLYDDDYHHPLLIDDYEIVKENDMPSEDNIPREEFYSFDEYNVGVKPVNADKDKLRNIKKLFLKPVVSLAAVAAIVLASFGKDPFKFDFLNKDSTVISVGTVSVEVSDDANASTTSEQTGADSDETSSETVAETEAEPEPDETDDAFPELDNLNPDFAGDYAWSGDGSEEYVRFVRDGDMSSSYLVKGGAWDIYDSDGQLVTDSTAVYDESTNTLTLNGFSASLLDVNLMGNGFTIELVGDNHIGTVSVWGAMYGGSVKFIGNGSLTVDNGISLNCEGSGSCFMVGKGVTLDISGENAVFIADTTMEDALYLSKSLKMTGGDVKLLDQNEYEGRVMNTFSIVDDAGNPSTHVRIEPVK